MARSSSAPGTPDKRERIPRAYRPAETDVWADLSENSRIFRRSRRKNHLATGSEVGAALCIYRDGRKVLDTWGGYRDGTSKAPWQADTMVNMFSSTKGVAALAIAHAVSKGLLDYDQRVSAYWPEFAAQDKDEVTVRQLLAHQAGLYIGPPDSIDRGRLATLHHWQRLEPLLHSKVIPAGRLGFHLVSDPRELAVRQALFRDVLGTRTQT